MATAPTRPTRPEDLGLPPPPAFERPVPVRFSHCDPAGIIFFPQYYVLFNALIEDWVSEALGIPYAELIGPRRVGLPTVSLATRFHAVSRMGETLRLGLNLERLGAHSLTLRLQARGSHPDARDGDLRMQTRQTLVTTDLTTHRAIALPADLQAAAARFAAATQPSTSGPPGEP